jgi:hypothetical protein
MKALLLAALLGQDVSSARERERVARLSLEAAKSKEFYFVAAAAANTLSLKLAGVPLAEYKLESIEIGRTLASDGESLALDDLYACTAPPRDPVEIVPSPPPAQKHRNGGEKPFVPGLV